MTKSISEALTQEGPLVAAWDYAKRDAGSVGIYAVNAAGARFLASDVVASGQRSAFEDDLRRRGVRVGATYSNAEFVWVTDEQGLALWSLSELRAHGTPAEIHAKARTFSPADVVRVVSFLDRGNLGHRGVAVELRDDSTLVIVDEHDAAAELDPTYNIENVMIDAAWATFFGRDLAAKLGVPHKDELP